MSARSLALVSIVVALSMRALASPAPPAARITLEDLVSVEGLSAPLLSPDGREFAFTADGQIKFLPIDGGFPVALTSTPGGTDQQSRRRRREHRDRNGGWTPARVGDAP